MFSIIESDIEWRDVSRWGCFVSVWSNTLHKCLSQPLGNSSLFCLTKGESEPSFVQPHLNLCLGIDMIFVQPFWEIAFLTSFMLTCPCFKRSEENFRCHDKAPLLLRFVNKAMFVHFFLLLLLLKAVTIFSAIESDNGWRHVSWRGDFLSVWSYSYCTLHRCCFWRSLRNLFTLLSEKRRIWAFFYSSQSQVVFGVPFLFPFVQLGLIFVCFPPSQI